MTDFDSLPHEEQLPILEALANEALRHYDLPPGTTAKMLNLSENATYKVEAPDGRRWADVFAEPKSLASVIRAGEWNTYRITCQGKKLKIEVNGVVTTDVEDDMDASGVIAIQHHGEKGATYKFRNLRIKELK